MSSTQNRQLALKMTSNFQTILLLFLLKRQICLRCSSTTVQLMTTKQIRTSFLHFTPAWSTCELMKHFDIWALERTQNVIYRNSSAEAVFTRRALKLRTSEACRSWMPLKTCRVWNIDFRPLTKQTETCVYISAVFSSKSHMHAVYGYRNGWEHQWKYVIFLNKYTMFTILNYISGITIEPKVNECRSIFDLLMFFLDVIAFLRLTSRNPKIPVHF